MSLTTIGVRELRDGATQIVRSVREDAAEYVVTVHGQPVAVIRPFTAEDAELLRLSRIRAHLAEQEALAREIAEHWTSPLSGVELVEGQRRG
jgi:prevent-host-death family protein